MHQNSNKTQGKNDTLIIIHKSKHTFVYLSIHIVSTDLYLLSAGFHIRANTNVGEWGWGIEGKQVGRMDEESQVRGCYKTFICIPTNQETVSVLEKTQANKTFRT